MTVIFIRKNQELGALINWRYYVICKTNTNFSNSSFCTLVDRYTHYLSESLNSKIKSCKSPVLKARLATVNLKCKCKKYCTHQRQDKTFFSLKGFFSNLVLLIMIHVPKKGSMFLIINNKSNLSFNNFWLSSFTSQITCFYSDFQYIVI